MQAHDHRYIVIIAGGSGERFWPESRQTTPKHLIQLLGEQSLLEQTIDRTTPIAGTQNILIITNATQAPKIRELCPQIPAANIIEEPCRRDTAAAIALAALIAQRRNKNASLAVLPADHFILKNQAFRKTLNTAFDWAEKEGYIATIGIPPRYPATGYGYIQRGAPLDPNQENGPNKVLCFREKPDLETATTYVRSGNYLWNAGMFISKASTLISELEHYTPSLIKELSSVQNLEDPEQITPIYESLEKISIDYAVMEKSQKIIVLHGEFGWDDLGEWTALSRHLPKDANNNVAIGNVILHDSKDNTVLSKGKHLVTALGVSDLIIVHTPDATLVCHKDHAQDIKKVVQDIREDEQFAHLQ